LYEQILLAVFKLPRLFGGMQIQKEQILLEMSESDLLSFLVQISSDGPLDPNSLLIRERAKRFYERQPIDATQLAINVLSNPINSFGEEYLNGVCETITVEDALELAAQNRAVLPLV
jgi:hypothetical protein